MRQRVQDWLEMPACQRKAAEHHDDENDKADGWKHGRGGPPNWPGAPGGSSELTTDRSDYLAQKVEQCPAIDPRKKRLRGIERKLISLNARNRCWQVGVFDAAAFLGDCGCRIDQAVTQRIEAGRAGTLFTANGA